MQGCKTPDEKIERLLTVEENIIGAENKRTLCTFIMPLIVSNTFEEQLLPGGQLPQRLKRLAELQQRVLRCGFQEVQKHQIAAALDGVALRIDERGKFLHSLETRVGNPVERAQTLLKLFAAGIFTQGDLMAKARRLLMASLSRPGFLSAYIAQHEQQKSAASDRNAVVAELTGQLESIGIAPEDCRRALAA
jgi:hypothetical protein